MKVFSFPLIPFTLFFAAGCVANALFISNSRILFLILIGSLLLFICAYYIKKPSLKANSFFGYSTMLVAFSLGIVTHSLNYEPNSKKHYSKLNIDKKVAIKGIVTENLKASPKNTKHILQITSINKTTATGKLLVYNAKQNRKKLQAGVEIVAFIQPIKIPKNNNPSQFDYSKYLANKNIFHQVFLKKNDFKIIGIQKTSDYYFTTLRSKLIQSFDHLNWNNQTTAIVNALLFGQKTYLDKATLTSYSNAGVVHVLAISGLHVGILFFFLKFLLQPLKRIRNGKFLFLISTLLILWLYALLTGMSPSVTRAVIMFSLYSIGQFLNKPNSTYNIIATSALLVLLYNPNYVFDIGFQMSYAAVLSIVIFQPFFKKFHFSKSKIIRYFTDLLLISLAAQIGVLPLSIYYFNQFPMLFLAANIFIIPAATALLILGLTTLFFNFTIPAISQLFGKVIEFLVYAMNTYINWISSYDSFIIKNISFSVLLCISAYTFLAFFMHWCYHTTAKNLKFVLVSVIGFQLAYGYTQISHKSGSQFVLFNSKNSLIAIQNQDTINFYCNNPKTNQDLIDNYKKGLFITESSTSPIRNVFAYNNKKILVLDSTGIYPKNRKVDLIMLTENAKVNLNRLIEELNPKEIIADNSNKYYLVNIWKATCKNKKIPFHATAEKGFYIVK